jgi:hypothetical protein
MDPRIAIAEDILGALNSLSDESEGRMNTMHQMCVKHNISMTSARLYVKVAELPPFIKQWINGNDQIPPLSFFTAAMSHHVFKENTSTMLTVAYESNMEAVYLGLPVVNKITIKYLLEIANEIGIDFNPRFDAGGDNLPPVTHYRHNADEYSYEWCLTRISRLVCQYLAKSIIYGVADDDTESFYVKMPKLYGSELRRVLMIMKSLAPDSANS